MHYVYLLKSIKFDEVYIGSTNDLRRRIDEHNSGKEISTKRYATWSLDSYEAYQSEQDARQREKILKQHGNTARQFKLKPKNSLKDFPSTIFRSQKNSAGFTLVETLVYIAIIGTVVTSFVFFSISVANSRNKNYVAQEVQANSRVALDLISQKMKMANGVNIASSTFGVDPGSLYLTMPSPAQDPTIISLDQDNGLLQITVGTSTGPTLQLEVGSVATDENWTVVSLQNTYTSPVVVASVQESANTLPVSVRIDNVSSTGFSVRLQNPSGADVESDEISYFVIEEGNWDIGGVLFEARKYDTSTVGSKNSWSFDSKTFTQNFTSDPIVAHQVMSYNDTNWVTSYVSGSAGRTNPPSIAGMRVALNTAEVASSHGSETIGWVAATMNSTSTVNNVLFESYRTSDSVQGHTNGCYTFSYQNTYASSPLVFSFQQEMDGNDGSWAVVCNNSVSQVGTHAEEDQIGDAERSHTSETSSFFAFEQAFAYSEARTLPIVSGKIKITNLVFTNLTPSGGKENIKIELTSEYDNPSGDVEFNYSQSWQTAVSLRQ